jgi:hypothetical protein
VNCAGFILYHYFFGIKGSSAKFKFIAQCGIGRSFLEAPVLTGTFLKIVGGKLRFIV